MQKPVSTSPNSNPTRNRTFDLLKFFSILYVQFTHFHEPKIFFYPALSFHVQAFIFVSGYTLGTRNQTFYGRMKSIGRRTFQLLAPYYCYQLFYTFVFPFIIQIVFAKQPIPAALQLIPFDPYEFFIESFVQASKNRFFEAAWFIPHLWLVQSIFILSYINPYRSRVVNLLYFILFFLLNIGATLWSTTAFGERPQTFVERAWFLPLQDNKYTSYDVLCFLAIRIGFSLVFIHLGVLYREYVEKSKFNTNYLFTFHGFIFAYIVMNLLWTIYGESINFFLSTIDFGGSSLPAYLPIVVVLLGVYIFMCISRVVECSISDNSFIYRISEKTYAIVCQHTMYFFFINFIIAKYIFGTEDAMSQVDCYWVPLFRPDLTWPLHIGLALALPTLVSLFGDVILSYWFAFTSKRVPIKYNKE